MGWPRGTVTAPRPSCCAGAVSAEHVRAIRAARATLAALAPHLERYRASLEADLAGFARTLDSDAVLKLGKRAPAGGCPPRVGSGRT
ncbi:hypothetical protein [Pseudonocardia sp. H11422]|uniref:hypothetical protein n=1 Tax=Pseudonocardia sp. H11422 TaxID=2835866 RepID=UPI0039776AA4